MTNDLVSVGVFIDGGYYAKINEGLEDKMKLCINLRGLFKYIREYISGEYAVDMADCHITEAHYYRGRYRVADANQKHLLYQERAFEDTLIENDVIFHYKHLREIRKNGDMTVIEKGVDVWFALETYELALYREFDTVILITGDADHEMLVKKLKALKVNVILLTWNIGLTSSSSPFLEEEACTHIELSEKVAADTSLLSKITKAV